MSNQSLVEVERLRKWFESDQSGLLSGLFGEEQYIKAVDDVSFDIKRGEILGLAGQSGCGKSTLGELLAGLQSPTRGSIHFDGEDITTFGRKQMKEFRRNCQVIFQDPYEAMNPRFSVARTVTEPLKIHGIGDREERDALAMEALEDAGLRPADDYLDKLPTELSGGERQRALIARAIVLDPDFLVADEPVSMLDVSIRTGILNLFAELREQRDLTMLYVSHDLSTINYLTDRTMIMYLGNTVELGPTQEVIHNPSHPYTESLLNAVPDPDPRAVRQPGKSQGDVPDPKDLPEGCRYRSRCAYATEQCATEEPARVARTTNGDPVETDGRGVSKTNAKSSRSVACYHPVHNE